MYCYIRFEQRIKCLYHALKLNQKQNYRWLSSTRRFLSRPRFAYIKIKILRSAVYFKSRLRVKLTVYINQLKLCQPDRVHLSITGINQQLNWWLFIFLLATNKNDNILSYQKWAWLPFIPGTCLPVSRTIGRPASPRKWKNNCRNPLRSK